MAHRSIIQTAVIALFLSALPVHQAFAEGQTPDKKKDLDPKIIPWVEVNTLSVKNKDYYTGAVAGIRVWKIVADEVIVSTNPYTGTITKLYSGIQRDCPGIKILPGIKTHGACKRIDDVAGWSKVGKAVSLACKVTGSKRCVMENESLFKPYVWGEYKPDWAKVEEGLNKLPKDIHYLWYPTVGGTQEVTRERFMKMSHLVLKVLPKVTVVSFEWSGPTMKSDPKLAEYERLRKQLDCPFIMICYSMYGEGQPKRFAKHWKITDLPYLLENCPKTEQGEFILYPGWTLFTSKGLEAAEVLYNYQKSRGKEKNSTVTRNTDNQ